MPKRDMTPAEIKIVRALEAWRDGICITAHAFSTGIVVPKPGSPWAVMSHASLLIGLQQVVDHISEWVEKISGETIEEQLEHSPVRKLNGGAEYLIGIVHPTTERKAWN